MSRRGDHAAVLRAAARAGCRIVRAERHLVIATPSGVRVIASNTPSDRNAVRNLRKDLLRAGVELDE